MSNRGPTPVPQYMRIRVQKAVNILARDVCDRRGVKYNDFIGIKKVKGAKGCQTRKHNDVIKARAEAIGRCRLAGVPHADIAVGLGLSKSMVHRYWDDYKDHYVTDPVKTTHIYRRRTSKTYRIMSAVFVHDALGIGITRLQEITDE